MIIDVDLDGFHQAEVVIQDCRNYRTFHGKLNTMGPIQYEF